MMRLKLFERDYEYRILREDEASEELIIHYRMKRLAFRMPLFDVASNPDLLQKLLPDQACQLGIRCALKNYVNQEFELNNHDSEFAMISVTREEDILLLNKKNGSYLKLPSALIVKNKNILMKLNSLQAFYIGFLSASNINSTNNIYPAPQSL